MEDNRNIKFCSYCGNEYADNSLICPKCGKKHDDKVWSPFKWYMHKRGKDNYAESFVDWLLGKLSFAMNVVLTVGVVVTGVNAVLPKAYDSRADYLVSYNYMCYSYGSIDSFNSFAASADSEYSMPKNHVVYDYCKKEKGWNIDVFSMAYPELDIYYGFFYTYYGQASNKNFKPIGTIDKVMINGKTYVTDDREYNRFDYMFFNYNLAHNMVWDYLRNILGEENIYYYQSTITPDKYGPVAAYSKTISDINRLGLYTDMDLITGRINKVYVFGYDSEADKAIGEIVFDYVDDCPVVVEDRKTDISFEQAHEVMSNVDEYLMKLRGEIYGK